jgi:hypothetical protein
VHVLEKAKPSAAIFENEPNLANHDSGLTFKKMNPLFKILDIPYTTIFW